MDTEQKNTSQGSKSTSSNQSRSAQNTDGEKNDNKNSNPAISVPKGGGAVKGIDEKFKVNPATGTGGQSISLPVSPGRGGFQPNLGLSYDSGAGNGAFGLGWNIGITSISRKTDKGLPRYIDPSIQSDSDSDVFTLSGAEDLVPVLELNSEQWSRPALIEKQENGINYTVIRYRPRIEGLYARIERWQNISTLEFHWRSIDGNNVTSIYGLNPQARIANPQQAEQVFTWFLEQIYDDKGNVLFYEYKLEDDAGVNRFASNERNRDHSLYAQQYLKRIHYGNRVMRNSQNHFDNSIELWQFMFQLVLDYGEHNTESPTPNEDQAWTLRADPFSSFRSGFEIRTQRLCHRLLMFHQFEELGLDPCLVASTELVYEENANISYLTQAIQTGYKKNNSADIDYLSRSLPAVEFAYSKAEINSEVSTISIQSVENLPSGMTSQNQRYIDLNSEGLSGFLAEKQGAWYYKPNLGQGEFGPATVVAHTPATVNGQTSAQIVDLGGDGKLDIVNWNQAIPGYYQRHFTLDQSYKFTNNFKNFIAFEKIPNINWRDPNLRMLDLNGDGHADILITENEVFCWYPSAAKQGYEQSNTVAKPFDEELGPALIFADIEQSIYLADMSGDGLVDLLRIRNGEVCYWPNMGYGNFGRKITFNNSPVFDDTDLFNQSRIQLADIDGTGRSDIVYLKSDEILIYFNQAGNSISDPEIITQFPSVDRLSDVTVVDLLGDGTACLVWSSPLSNDSQRPMQYIHLMRQGKPHLLNHVKNNMGAETQIRYVASTQFYLEDKKNNVPWVTKLHFPVHVVEKIEFRDFISNTKFVSSYSYHHGYYDGQEREFRGFARVEQLDTETYEAFSGIGLFTETPNILDKEFHLPPVRTKTWFHTGAFIEAGSLEEYFKQKEFYQDPEANYLPDTLLPSNLSANETREAARALKGVSLRQEVYAEDNSEQSAHPYSVSEQSYELNLVQAKGDNKFSVFASYPCEAINFHYERNNQDPRISHTLTLEVDQYGTVTKSAAIAYPRRAAMGIDLDPIIMNAQQVAYATYSEVAVTHLDQSEDFYRIGLPIESRTYEITRLNDRLAGMSVPNLEGIEKDKIFSRQSLKLLLGISDDLIETNQALDSIKIAYDDELESLNPVNKTRLRIVEHSRQTYLQNDLLSCLALNIVESLALPCKSYTLAFTQNQIDTVYQGEVDDTIMLNEAAYFRFANDSDWWIQTGTQLFNPDRFYQVASSTDIFGNQSDYTYDINNIALIGTIDPLGNEVSAELDYRVLQPSQVTDPNQTRTQVRFDILGMVVGTAIIGSQGEGDNFDEFTEDPAQTLIDEYLANPLSNAAQQLIGSATSRLIYTIDRYEQNQTPNVVASIARATHVANLITGEQSNLQHSFVYSDTTGQQVLNKVQAEPGFAPERDPVTRELVLNNGEVNLIEVNPRWVGNGKTVFDNKGNPVKQYEPFFTDTHFYETEQALTATGVTPIMRYDPLGRLMRTELPDGTFTRVEFTPWSQTAWDQNDTLLESEWFSVRENLNANEIATEAENRAATITEAHANTPTITHLDTLGRSFFVVADNGSFGQYQTRTELDIEGNALAIIDARGNTVEAKIFNVAGQAIQVASMDEGLGLAEESENLPGISRILANGAGNPVRSWDVRDQRFRIRYDELQRPRENYVRLSAEQDPAQTEILFECMFYGEQLDQNIPANVTQINTNNQRGQAIMAFDGAGRVFNTAFDFKGNPISSSRQLTINYRNIINWQSLADLDLINDWGDLETIVNNDVDFDNNLEAEIFSSSSQFDALSRPIEIITPDNSRLHPEYNEANLLNSVSANLRNSNQITDFVTNIDYDAKGQRERIRYANGITTTYQYNALTFRLRNLSSRKQGSVDAIQDLNYTYDPVGNITEVRDDAIKTIFFANQVIAPTSRYEYDPIYQLITAEGREQIKGPQEHANQYRDSSPNTIPHANDLMSLRNYSQQYNYDEVGNILRMIHTATNGNYRRNYEYNQTNNRLTQTWFGQAIDFDAATKENYQYDAAGSMLGMQHLPVMDWDFKNQLIHASRSDDELNGEVFFTYDAGGERVRKVFESGANQNRREHIYLGGFEIFREGSNGNIDTERETLHIMDDTRRIVMVETQTRENNQAIDNPVNRQRYQLTNHLDSATIELDNSANEISYEEYHPFGTTSFHSFNSNAQVSAKRYRYTGKEKDDETRLNYHGARYYACWLGRWTAADPIGIGDGLNIYTYVKNRPILFVDFTGTIGVPDPDSKIGKAIRALGVWAGLSGQTPNDVPKPPVKPSPVSPSENPDLGKSKDGSSNKAKAKRGTTRTVTGEPNLTGDNRMGPTHHNKQTVFDSGDLQIQEGAEHRGKKGNFLVEVPDGNGRPKVIADFTGPKPLKKIVDVADGGAISKLGKIIGRGASKLGPAGAVIGVGIGLKALEEGNYIEGVLDIGGAIPVIGELLDVGVAAYEIGQVLDEHFEISDKLVGFTEEVERLPEAYRKKVKRGSPGFLKPKSTPKPKLKPIKKTPTEYIDFSDEPIFVGPPLPEHLDFRNARIS